MFHNPIRMQAGETPLIVYPCESVKKFLESRKLVEKYIESLYRANSKKLSENGQFNINILWADKGDAMLDIWKYDKLETWGSGPLVDVSIFRNHYQDRQSGVSAGDGLVLLGLEEQHRWKCKSLKEYLDGPRPRLPDRISNQTDF